MLADIHAWPLPLTGYITSGGTESHLFALWVARNKLGGRAGGSRGLPAVLVPVSAHYSFLKALDILGWRRSEWFADGGGVGWVDLGPDLRVDLDDFRRKLKRLLPTAAKNGLIVVGSAMTSDVGRCDPLAAMVALSRQALPRERVHVHADGCMGSLLLPFLEATDEEATGCRQLGSLDVDSTSIDLHKLGGVPYGCGAVLLRNRDFEAVRMPVAYLTSGVDATLMGSRPGSAATSAWCALLHLGRRGFVRQASRCVALAERLRAGLTATGAFEVLSPAWSNYSTVRLRRRHDAVTRAILARWTRITPEYSISSTRISRTEKELRAILSGHRAAGVPADKVVVMPHVRRVQIDELLRAVGVRPR